MKHQSTLRKGRPENARDSTQGRIRPRNQMLLKWLDSWLATPDDRGEEWWKEFEADLEKRRLTGVP